MELVISYTLLAVLAVDLLAMTGDSTMTWTSPMYEKLKSNDSSINPLGRPITSEEDGWLGSLINIGAMIGPFLFGWISEKVGRKIALLSIALPHFVAYLTLSFAQSINLYYFARLLAGIAVGGGYTLMPLYIAEIAENENRGMMSVTLNIFWTLGNFIPYSVGPYISTMSFNLLLSCLPLFFFVVFLMIAPETPYYLVRRNKIVEAEKTLMLLRSCTSNGIEKEIQAIKVSIASEKTGKFIDIIQNPVLRKGLTISLMLIIFQQLSGINAILFYLEPIFEASGTNIPSDISAIIVGAFLFSSSFITPFVADRLGRRLLLIISSFGTASSLFVLGVFFYIHDKTNINTDVIYFLPLLSLIAFILSFNFGISSVPWTISSELFPSNVRSYSSSATSCTCWLTSFIVTKLFNAMNESEMGRGGTFCLYGGITMLAGVFSIFCVPETKGKSFEEIQILLES